MERVYSFGEEEFSEKLWEKEIELFDVYVGDTG